MLNNYLDKLILNKKKSVYETAATGVLISELNHEKKECEECLSKRI
ncbi:MAG: hypothetical protein BMS9Abin39_0471 [Ignavibacteria bacterium]|nr:MAG: hypothetical protein BMS9Abin39_0471 [Ignavibacteria bacterium]